MTAKDGNRPPSFAELASLLFHPAANEVGTLLKSLDFEDLTACELVTIANALRAAWERKQARLNPPVVLKMVRNQSG